MSFDQCCETDCRVTEKLGTDHRVEEIGELETTISFEYVDVVFRGMEKHSNLGRGEDRRQRSEYFGSVDPETTKINPGKDGPSSPANEKSFEVGEKVIVFIYGNGKQSPVHLTLNIDALGKGASSVAKKILKGTMDPVEMQVGDEAFVFNEGTGAQSYGDSLDDRLETATDDPDRDIVMAVVETLPDSRDADGKLTGKVRVADFVAVHLDEIVEKEIVDPNNPKKMITVRYLMGTVTNRRAETSWGGATPSGAGGASVRVVELVQ